MVSQRKTFLIIINSNNKYIYYYSHLDDILNNHIFKNKNMMGMK